MIKALSEIFGGKTFGRLFLATIWSIFSMWFVAYILMHKIETDSLPFVNTFKSLASLGIILVVRKVAPIRMCHNQLKA